MLGRTRQGKVSQDGVVVGLASVHHSASSKIEPCLLTAVFLNRWAAARHRALASIIPGRERFSWNL